MEKKNDYVLNPNTNRFIKKDTPTYKRLIKAGVLNEGEVYKPPALVVEKKVKAVANVKELTHNEINDLFEQLQMLKAKRDDIEKRRSGRPSGSFGDLNKPKLKEELKKTPKDKFNVSIKASVPKFSETEYEGSDV